MSNRGKGRVRKGEKYQPELQAEVVFVPASNAEERLRKAFQLLLAAGARPEEPGQTPENGAE